MPLSAASRSRCDEYHSGDLRPYSSLSMAGCFYPALRYSEGVTMRVPRYAPRINKSLSPATSKSAFARAAHSRNISSFGSRQTFTVPRIFTRMPRARIACSADVALCRSQENVFRQDTHNLRVNLITGGNHVFAHCLFKRQRRRAATFRKLKRGNPGVCVYDDDHPLDRTLRRRGFSARTSLMSWGTSASV
jgi:hypothetical protein